MPNTLKIFSIAFLIILTGCATVDMPAGQENRREFVYQTNTPYLEAYQTIAKQMRACYRVIGVFGNGYDVQADLDSANRNGRVELYHVGLTGASKPEDSMLSRVVSIKASETGSIITTTGTTPRVVYANHLMVRSWLSGNDTCGLR